MFDIVFAPAARADIADILAWTEESFGLPAMKRYHTLISVAILAEDPYRRGSVDRSEIGPSCRTYHLFHSRKQAAREGGRVKKPRHFIVYRTREESTLEIGRFLHDSMDIVQRISRERWE